MRLNPTLVQDFAATLPEAYRAVFDWAAIAEHAELSYRRTPGSTAVGSFVAPRHWGLALCIVADDRSGLLAALSGALLSERLDVVAAEAYTRRVNPKHREAVDVFWVQRLDEQDPRRMFSDADLQALGRNIDAWLDHPSLLSLPAAGPLPPGGSQSNVRFISNRAGQLATLEVDTDDRPGLLWVLARTLFEHDVQIVASQVQTKAGRVHDRFDITELNDEPISAARRLGLQVAVLDAIQQALARR